MNSKKTYLDLEGNVPLNFSSSLSKLDIGAGPENPPRGRSGALESPATGGLAPAKGRTGTGILEGRGRGFGVDKLVGVAVGDM